MAWIRQLEVMIARTDKEFRDRLEETFQEAIRNSRVTIDPHIRAEGMCINKDRIVLRTHNPSVFYHELVHRMGGNEVDTEAFEGLYALGPSDPTRSDHMLFDRLRWKGCFICLDRHNGAVRCHSGRLLGYIPLRYR